MAVCGGQLRLSRRPWLRVVSEDARYVQDAPSVGAGSAIRPTAPLLEYFWFF